MKNPKDERPSLPRRKLHQDVGLGAIRPDTIDPRNGLRTPGEIISASTQNSAGNRTSATSLATWNDYEKDMSRLRKELSERTSQLEMERAEFQKYVGDKEKQLKSESDAMRRDYSERLAGLEIQRKEESKKSYEIIADAQRKIAEASHQFSVIDTERKKLEADKLQYDEENNKRLQAQSVVFVTQVVSDLKDREKTLSKISLWWSLAGGAALCLAAVPAGVIITHSAIWPNTNSSWPILLMQTMKSAVFVALAGIIARYAFLLSKRYLNESLKVSETIHGVSFGQLYVQSYGASAGWDQVKDAFSKWHLRSEGNTTISNDGGEDRSLKGLDGENIGAIVKILSKLKE